MHCIRSIQLKAEESSGISAEELYKIDELDLVEKLGEATLITLCGCFFDKVYAHAELMQLYESVQKDDMTQNMYEFLIERFGGPKYFTERKGTPALYHRHHDVAFTEDNCDAWLELMRRSLREQPELIDDDTCNVLMNYFTYTAHSIMVYHKEAAILVPEILKTS